MINLDLQENQFKKNKNKIKISLNIHVKQIKNIHQIQRHNEIMIIIPNQ